MNTDSTSADSCNADSPNAVTLVVINSEQLQGRSTSSHVFNKEGGALGSGASDDWLLQNHSGRIFSRHAEVIKIDGRFCLVDCSGHTYINGATLPIGKNRKAVLNNGDELRVGNYCLKVHLGNGDAWQPGMASLAAVIGEENEIEIVEENVKPANDHHRAGRSGLSVDPIEALGGGNQGTQQHDPINALNAKNHPPPLLDDIEDAGFLASDDQRNIQKTDKPRDLSRSQGIKPQRFSEKKTYRSSDMDERQINDLERTVGEQLEERWQPSTKQALSHLGSDPLLRGLGVDLPFRDSEEQQAFLQEAGQTLRATIDGLRLLQQSQNDSKYPLRDRRLQPIEDNPLRLGMTFEETAETMFSAQRSLVHLSAPEAVSESLRHQGQHQAAVEDAIGQALGAILEAFSPEALLKRFHAYRGAANRIDDEGDWAWDMYQHYYRELNSGRQQGFQKLFWEVFEQAYDQSVRRQQREEA